MPTIQKNFPTYSLSPQIKCTGEAETASLFQG